MSLRSQPRSAWTVLAALIPLLSGCPDDPPGPVSRAWQAVATELPEAALSVTGTSARDVWVVGADKGSGPLVLHYDGARWERVGTATRGDLWWAQAFADGTVWMGGASATLLRHQGGRIERFAAPGSARATVFGLWGARPDDVYAVGSTAGRNGFVWHFDGTSWRDTALPSSLPDVNPTHDGPAFFKVWGRSADDVWVVGELGVALHGRAGAFTPFDTGTTRRLFTVHGDAQRTFLVGGDAQGVLQESSGAAAAFAGRAPDDAQLLQGVCSSGDAAWAVGQGCRVFQRVGAAWREEDHGLRLTAQSLHAVWIDPGGGVWAVGGNVLSTSLDAGVIAHYGAAVAAVASPAGRDAGVDGGDASTPVTCPEGAIDPAPTGSIARRWNEQILNAIRRDVPRPGVHARNLFHLSVAMWDAWAAYDATADGYVSTARSTATDPAAARREAISYAAHRLLTQRYARANGGALSTACFDAFLRRLGYDPAATDTAGDSPHSVGNRIGRAVIDATLDDGANERNAYADTTGYVSPNPALSVDSPGTVLTDPSRWQPLDLATAITQNGIVLDSGRQQYIGANWGMVRPFALPPRADGAAYFPHVAPSATQPEMGPWMVDVIRRERQLDTTTGDPIDLSPGSMGNNSLGADDGRGRPMNPVTGQPYAPQRALPGDFGRVLAEFWADGPHSETPPGHWNVLANQVSDSPGFARRWHGGGPALDPLAWDVRAYLALNGATHDAAIAAWELKRRFISSRPISLIRWMAGLGQSSDPSAPGYHPNGLPLVPGLIEQVTAASSAPGQRHARLARYRDQVVVLGWVGEPGDPRTQVGGVDWVRGIDWVPYQRRTFVTPAFPGFVSGHSTFSRAAAEVLARITGSEFFPGGLGEFVARENEYLTFERGPTAAVRLQWATYFDAADQAGQSRIWGGIHLQPDDFVGRRVGHDVGLAAATLAERYISGSALP
ncbi:MAG: vanadium-dependent haloperoxidase [Deltaproteobacteria bacterium]|nr:vanadium-dependent haloperoxidase [Deltaproteobacteria bacterium]